MLSSEEHGCCCRGPGFGPQHPHGGLQLVIIPDPTFHGIQSPLLTPVSIRQNIHSDIINISLPKRGICVY